MIRESMPSGYDPTGVQRFSERIMLNQKPTRAHRNAKNSEAAAVISSAKRQNDYQGYRNGAPERTFYISSMPILIGAAMIAAAILLSTLLNALGTRYVGIEGPTEESAWLIDRVTGSIYRCQAAVRGKASCETEIATGSVAAHAKQ
jgi:hypothetical protein